MTANRETSRDALATLLDTALTGVGNPVQTVYNYQIGDFQGQSPVVVVSSGGTERTPYTFEGDRATFHLNIFVFVLYDDEGDWGEDDAEDRIDLIEKDIAETLESNQRTTNWESIQYSAGTTVDSVEIGGDEYRREVIPVVVEVF